MTITGHLAEAVQWFVEHETDRRGPAGSPYELMRRNFDLNFDEACMVCREVRKRGPFKGGGGIDDQKSNRPQTARADLRAKSSRILVEV